MTASAITTTFTNEHVDVVSTKSFEATVKDLRAELGRAGTDKLMDRLAGAPDWENYAEQCTDFAGRSKLIEVGFLDWGKVLTLSGTAMRAKCFIVGNPVTASKLLGAGGPEAGLYLPTKIYVFEAKDASVHVAYDKFAPVMAQFGNEGLSKVADVIDGVLAGLADAAAN
ncbi:MAG: DUF302 domain-containing protein [Sporichthyaceae bacterium]